MKMFLWEVWPPTLECKFKGLAPSFVQTGQQPAVSEGPACQLKTAQSSLPPSKQDPRNPPLQLSELSSCPCEMGAILNFMVGCEDHRELRSQEGPLTPWYYLSHSP